MTKQIRAIKQQIAGRCTVTAHVHQDPYTFVSLHFIDNYLAPTGLTGIGFAKRIPWDEPDPDLGFEIAYGRALAQLAWKVWNAMMDRHTFIDTTTGWASFAIPDHTTDWTPLSHGPGEIATVVFGGGVCDSEVESEE